MILVAGEALVDLVLGGGWALTAHPGGGPFNTARTIGRLEQPVAFLGRLSGDRFGATLERMLSEDGVALDAVVRTDDPTTLALAEIDATGSARYRFYVDGTAAPGLTAAEALAALPRGVDAVHVGSLGLALEPVASALEAVVEGAGDDALVVVDPNVRPWVVRDEAAYRARLARVLARADVVKASEEDLAWLQPGRPPVEAARAVTDGVALVTLGPRGAVVVTPDAEVAVPAVDVAVVDTIGAGDAFGGGFVAWWRARGLGREALGELDAVVEGCRFAARVSARTCERAGASPPWLREVGPDSV